LLILDLSATKTILQVTCDILEKKFFYDTDAISRFLNTFSKVVGEELETFMNHAYTETLDEITSSRLTRLYFTNYFISANLRNILKKHLYFTEQEICAFENFLPQYTGDRHGKQQPKYERTDNRKFFE
jgi:hypothetical protein